MSDKEKVFVLEAFKRYCADGGLKQIKKKSPRLAEQMRALLPEDIDLGPRPYLIFCCVEGNSTAVGESTFGNTISQRTVSIDHCTEPKLFMMNNNAADKRDCKKAALRFNYGDRVYKGTDDFYLAEAQGRELCKRDLSDLNFSMKSYRLNRWKLVRAGEPFNAPIRHIYANIKSGNKQKKISLGYLVDKNGVLNADFNVTIPALRRRLAVVCGVGVAFALFAVLLACLL